jgi:flagellar basal-body rod protein FlgB
MSNSLFGGLDKLGRALDASWTKNEVISSNIANIDTPGYKRKKVEFGDLLNEKKLSLSNKIGDSKSISNESSSEKNEDVKIINDLSSSSLRTDGNNVNIDTEMSELSKNIIYYNVLSQRTTGEITKLRDAIKGS